MGSEERVERMQALRDTVERNNIYRWAGKFLAALASFQCKTGNSAWEAGLSVLPPQPLQNARYA
ncbi:MAG: hypothetical protein HYZ72_03075 [Deltaproteobacteria bacterium]|nr:hypothetical protein [Deltaproteobacteria bacterium]